MDERVTGLVAGAILFFLGSFGVRAEPQALHALAVADPVASEMVPANRRSEFAQRSMQLHLAKVGLERALDEARLRAAELPGRRLAARQRRALAVERLREQRVGVTRRLSGILAARQSSSSPRATAIRRSALRMSAQAWQAAETASLDPAPADAWFDRERVGALQLADRLADRIDALAVERDLMAVRELAATRSASAADTPTSLLATLEAAHTFSSAEVKVGWRSVVGADDADRTGPIGWPDVLASVLVGRTDQATLHSVDRGLELEVATIAAVRAPEAGRVVYAGSFRSYGQLLIIDHGDEYHTLVAGLSHLDVAEGTVVRAGDPIGSVAGVSGRAGRLYMEVRHVGVPLDPMPWLTARDYKVRG